MRHIPTSFVFIFSVSAVPSSCSLVSPRQRLHRVAVPKSGPRHRRPRAHTARQICSIRLPDMTLCRWCHTSVSSMPPPPQDAAWSPAEKVPSLGMDTSPRAEGLEWGRGVEGCLAGVGNAVLSPFSGHSSGIAVPREKGKHGTECACTRSRALSPQWDFIEMDPASLGRVEMVAPSDARALVHTHINTLLARSDKMHMLHAFFSRAWHSLIPCF